MKLDRFYPLWRWNGITLPAGWLGAAYAAWALPVLLAISLIAPPWTATDEPFHMARAVSIAHGHIVGQRWPATPAAPAGAGGLSDMAIYTAFSGLARMSWLPNQPDGQLTREILAKSEQVKWRKTLVRMWFGATAQYGPVFYLPDVAAYWFGRAAGMRVDATLRLARMANALAFVLMGAIAVSRARRTRFLMAALLMLPMTLVLAASANQDAGMIGVMALIVAQADRIADAGRSPGRGELLLMGLGLACVAMGRPPYAALALLLLVCAPNRWGMIATAVTLGFVAIWSAAVAVWVMQPAADAVPGAQMAGLLMHPAAIPGLAVKTLRLSLGDYAWQFIGQLSWNDVPLPSVYIGLAATCLVMTAVASAYGHGFFPRAVVAAVALAVVGIFGLLYLNWTKLGLDHVAGVEGRHFVPLALPVALALPTIRWARYFQLPAYGALAATAAVTPVVVVHHLVSHFYIK